MATIEELSSALVKADAAGNVDDAKAFADAIRQMRNAAPSEIPGARRSSASQIPTEPGANLAPTPQAPVSMLDRIRGAAEVLPAMAGGAIGGVVAPIAQLGHELFGGQAFTPQGKAAAAEFGRKVQGQFYQPRTEQGQEYTAAIGNALAPMIGVPIPTLNALGQSAPAAARAIRDVGRSEANLIGGAIAAPLEARAARIQEGRVAQSYANAPQIEAAQAANRHGLALNPAVSNPTLSNRAKGALVGNVKVNEKLNSENIAKLPNLAKEEMGLPSNVTLNEKTYAQAREKLSAPYEEIRKLPTLAPDATVLSTIDGLRSEALIGGETAAKSVSKLVDSALGNIQQGIDGNLALKNIRQLRDEAQIINNAKKKGNPISPEANAEAVAKMGIANALESLIEANITDPQALQNFRAARTAMAKTYAYENATDFNTGKIDPQAIAKLTSTNNALTGTIADIGKIAGNNPEVMSLGASAKMTKGQQLTRSGLAGTIGAGLGLSVGQPILGGVLGAAAGSLMSRMGATKIASPAYQAAKAVPADYRPSPNMLRPVEPNATPNALVPYDYSQQVLTPDQIPNFVMRPGGYGPVTTPGVAPGPAQIGMAEGPVGGQMGALRMEDIRARDLSMRQGAAAEAQQAAAAAAVPRKPATGGVQFDLDPITGKLVPTSAGVKGATPEVFMANTGQSLNAAAEKVAAGKLFDMTLAEKTAWNKTKVDLATAAPELKGLSDKAVAAKMMDRQWVGDTMKKLRQEAAAFEEIAQRAKTAQAARDALMQREKMLDRLSDLEDMLRPARPVSSGIQGRKTREFNRNQLMTNTANKNALANSP